MVQAVQSASHNLRGPETRSLQPGEAVTVALVWLVEETPTASYHVFLHLLDPEGRLEAQSDGVPADWTRPTTGWVPEEYITDMHTLTLPRGAPADEYTLSAGLYVPKGERLAAPDGSDAILLMTFLVEGQ